MYQLASHMHPFTLLTNTWSFVFLRSWESTLEKFPEIPETKYFAVNLITKFYKGGFLIPFRVFTWNINEKYNFYENSIHIISIETLEQPQNQYLFNFESRFTTKCSVSGYFG